MAKSEESIEELVSKIERGVLRLPEMQRRYVWRSTRVRDLLDSLYRGYPSGAILLWETDEDVPLKDFAIQQKEYSPQSTQLLLDGQQRLTSLAAIIRGKPVNVRGRKKPIELLFNLEHPDKLTVVTEVDENGPDSGNGEQPIEDEADSTEDELQKRFDKMIFVVATKKLARLPQWIKVTDVFKSDSVVKFLEQAGVSDFNDPKFKRYNERLTRLKSIPKNYIYRIDVLERELSYDEVTEIFVRVNSLGAKLRSSDLALAQITAKWRGALKEFQSFKQQCDNSGIALDLGLHIKNLVAFATGQSGFHIVAGLDRKKLENAWKGSRQGMEFSINFLKNNLRITSPALLSSPFILIALAYYGHKHNYSLSSQEAQDLHRWMLLANAKGRYSRGSSETLLNQDLAILRDGGGTKELTERLLQQVGRLDIPPEELEGRNQRSALFKMMFLAFSAAGAKDWRSQLAIALNLSGVQHKLQFHHIFPKAILKGKYSIREIDDIANLCFISGKTNRQIKDKTPEEYFPGIIKKSGLDAFESQCIPTDTRLLDIDSYKAFLQERRKQIAERLNQFLNDPGN